MLEYQLLPQEGLQKPESSYSGIGVGDPQADIVTRWNSFPLAASLLATMRVVIGLPLDSIILVPLIPIGGFTAGYLIVREISGSSLAGITAASIITLQFLLKLPHFQQYQFGRFVALLFALFVFIKILYRIEYAIRYTTLFVLLLVLTKFSAPASEVILVTTACVAFLSTFMQNKVLDRRSINLRPAKSLFPVAIFAIVLLLAHNPKFYTGILRGVASAGEGAIAVSSIGDMISNLSVIFERVIFIFTNQSYSSTAVRFEVSATTPFFVRIIGIIIYLSLFASVGIKYLREVYERNWSWFIRPSSIFIHSVFTGALIDTMYRAALTARLSIRGFYLMIPLIGVAIWVELTEGDRRIFVAGLITCSLLAAVSFGTIMFVGDPTHKPYNSEATESLADWHDLEEQPRVLTDHNTMGQLAYHHGRLGDPIYESEFELITYNPRRYHGLITGDINRSQFNCYIVNRDSLSKPIRQGPPRWRSFEPLVNHYTTIRLSSGLNRVYSNGHFDAYC